MKLITGDIWGELGSAKVIFVTTNAEVNGAGRLVMGRGAALQAAQLFPGLAEWLGRDLVVHKLVGKPYGLIVQSPAPAKGAGTFVGAFQVKFHWRDDADPDLIRFSVARLGQLAALLRPNVLAVNMPGVGNGRLREEDVLPLLLPLPNNVRVYRLPGGRDRPEDFDESAMRLKEGRC